LISQKPTFDSCFEVFLADTQESKQIHYNLRYQVYCEEMGFEDKTLFPDEMEYDEWDIQDSVHFLVRHKVSGEWLGGLRLVSPRKNQLPFEKLITSEYPITEVDRNRTVEMSRLCVIKEARRFSSKRFAPYGLPENEVPKENDKIRSLYNFKNQTRSIMWGLIRAAVEYSKDKDLQHWYFIIAPALAGFIRREGFAMQKIGEPCEHRGVRTPYKLSVENILNNPLWLNDYKNGYQLCSNLATQQQAKRLGVG